MPNFPDFLRLFSTVLQNFPRKFLCLIPLIYIKYQLLHKIPRKFLSQISPIFYSSPHIINLHIQISPISYILCVPLLNA